MEKLIRNLSTPENRAFWAGVEKTAAEVRTWPAWKRAGLNFSSDYIRSEPRTVVNTPIKYKPGMLVSFSELLEFRTGENVGILIEQITDHIEHSNWKVLVNEKVWIVDEYYFSLHCSLEEL